LSEWCHRKFQFHEKYNSPVFSSDQDEQFESWRKEFQQERLLRIVREREIMKETAKRCK
jgi:hypothetical protein